MDVFVLFAGLAVAAVLVVAVLARKQGPIPSTGRSSEPGNIDPERDQTLDRPAGPGAEAERVAEAGEVSPGPSREERPE